MEVVYPQINSLVATATSYLPQASEYLVSASRELPNQIPEYLAKAHLMLPSMNGYGYQIAGGAALIYFGHNALKWADIIRGASSGVTFAGYLPAMFDLKKKPSKQLENLDRTLKEIKVEENREKKIQKVSALFEQLDELLSAPQDYKTLFKGCSYFSTWKGYLSPLIHLRNAAEDIQLLGGHGLHEAELDRLISDAEAFISREASLQTGLLVKGSRMAINTLCEEVKGRCLQEKQKIEGVDEEPPPSYEPFLMTFRREITSLKLSPDQDYMKKERLDQLFKALAKSDPMFESLLDEYNTKNWEYIEELLPKIPLFVTKYLIEKMPHLDSVDQRKKLEKLKESDLAKEINQVWSRAATYLEQNNTKFLIDETFSRVGNFSEVSERIDRLLIFVSSMQTLPEAKVWLQATPKWIEAFCKATFDLAYKSNKLTPDELEKLKSALNEVHKLAKEEKLLGALRKLKEIYERGPVGSQFKKEMSQPTSFSPLCTLAQEFILKESRPTQIEKEMIREELLRKKERLNESLTQFVAFRLVDQYLLDTSKEDTEEAFQERYSKFYEAIDRVSDPTERREALLNGLKAMIDNSKKLNFFTRLTGKWFFRIAYVIVEHYLKETTTSVTDRILEMFKEPIAEPLLNDHSWVIKAANDIVTKLLIAEEQCGNKQGALCFGDKRSRVRLILETLFSHSTASQIKNIALNGIEKYLEPPSFSKVFGRAKERVSQLGKKGTIGKALSTIGMATLTITSIPAYLLQVGVSLIQRRVVRIYLSEKKVSGIFKKGMDSLFRDRRYASGFDKVLLKNLKELEKPLDSEGDESFSMPRAGQQQQTIVDELVTNLLELLKRREFLTQGSIRKGNDQKQGVGFPDDQILESTKQSLKKVILTAGETLNDEYRVQALLVDTFDEIGCTFRPTSQEQHLRELLKDEELKSCQSEDGEIDEHAFIQKIQEKYGIQPDGFGRFKRSEMNKALRTRYEERELEIDQSLDHLLSRETAKIVESGKDGLLKSTEKTANKLFSFLELELIPHRMTLNKVGTLSHIEKIFACCKEKDIVELRKVHTKFLNRLTILLQELESLSSKDVDQAFTIQMIDRMIHRLTSPLNELNKAIAKQKLPEIEKMTFELNEAMRKEESTLMTLRFKLRSHAKTTQSQLRQFAEGCITYGLEAASPIGERYLKKTLEPLVKTGIGMARDPNLCLAGANAVAELVQEHQLRRPYTHLPLKGS